MARLLAKPEFDRDNDFVVFRQFTAQGKNQTPGKLFDKTLTTTRKLRQLYEGNYLRMEPAAVRGRASLSKIAFGVDKDKNKEEKEITIGGQTSPADTEQHDPGGTADDRAPAKRERVRLTRQLEASM